MKKDKYRPVIRFKEFNNDWEQRKLEQIVNVGSGRDYKHLSVGNIPVYGTGGLMLRVDKALSYDRDAVGIGRKGTIDKPYILKAPFWTVDTLFYVTPNDDYNLDFIFNIFRNIHWKRFDESTGVPSLSKTTINSIQIKTPGLSEQEQIGSLFKKLDSLITLHQRKLNSLENIKKYLLSTMFPKKGSNAPEIRFGEFTDAWVQRKFKNVFSEIQSGNRLPKDGLIKGSMPYVLATVDNNGVFMEIDKNTLDYHGNPMKKFTSPSITFSIDNPEAIFIQKRPFYTSNIMRVLNNDELNVDQYHFYFEYLKTLTTYFNWSLKFSGPVVHNSKIMLPTFENGKINSSEVERIGSLFKIIDNTITLHQRKLEKLEELKKYFLKMMFI